jgi:hypothetical protein
MTVLDDGPATCAYPRRADREAYLVEPMPVIVPTFG